MVLRVDTPGFAYPFYAGGGMNNVEYFDMRAGNPVNNQMGIEDNITVHAAFCSKMTALGIKDIVNRKRGKRFYNLLLIMFCLKKTKGFKSLYIHLLSAFCKLITDYNLLLSSSCFHFSNFRCASSTGVNGPCSISRKCSHHSSCVPWKGMFGFQVPDEEVLPLEATYFKVGSFAFDSFRSCGVCVFFAMFRINLPVKIQS